MSDKQSRILTIGMAVHDDYAGVWSTIQFIRRHYAREMQKHIEFLVLDNNPRSPQGRAVRKYMTRKFNQEACPGYYMSVEPRKGTAMRDLLVRACNTEYMLMIDSHVNVMGLDKTILFLRHSCQHTLDHFSGILVNEAGAVMGTHQNPGLRGGMFGTWGVHPQPKGMTYADMEPFEIPMHGCGLMLFRRDDWLGFHVGFRDFGGEEGYIHEKYRLHGRRCWTLPFLTWEHRFGHPGGTSYPLTHEGKYWNNLIAWTELGLPVDKIHHYFGSRCKPERAAEIRRSVEAMNITPIPRNGLDPFMGYPIRINDMEPKESEDYKPYEKLVFAH